MSAGQPRQTHLQRQSGVALLVVLLIVALVSVIATEMGGRLQLQVKRITNIKDSNQAYWYAMAAEEYAQIAINRLAEEADGIIHNQQSWAQADLTFPLPDGSIQAELVDMQSCFNLNALQLKVENADAAGQQTPAEALKRLLALEAIQAPGFDADTFTASLTDWLDADDTISSSYGAEDADYESRTFPYLPANNLMVNKTELRLVNGVQLPWLNKLLPLVCAIPGETALRINVNTLSEQQAPLLAALLGISVADANNLISNIPYDSKQTFLSQSEVAGQPLSDRQKEWFDITTQYFILHTKSHYNNATFAMSSVFQLDESNIARVIRREFGGKS